jgi:hypothetical protein
MLKMSSAVYSSPSGPCLLNVAVASPTSNTLKPRLPAMRVVVETQWSVVILQLYGIGSECLPYRFAIMVDLSDVLYRPRRVHLDSESLDLGVSYEERDRFRTGSRECSLCDIGHFIPFSLVDGW